MSLINRQYKVRLYWGMCTQKNDHMNNEEERRTKKFRLS